MSATDASITSAIKIGEHCFYLDNRSPVRLGCDSLEDFRRMHERIFSTPDLQKQYPLDRVKALCIRYLPYSGPVLDGITSKDRRDLLSILMLYHDNIATNSAASNGKSLLQSRFPAYLPSIKVLIEQLTKSSVQKADKLKTVLGKIDEKKIPFIIMRLSWFLTHRDKIQEGDAEEWTNLLESNQSHNLDEHVQSLNSFKGDTALPSMDEFKEAGDVEALAKKPVDGAEQQFKVLLKILTAKGYLDDSFDQERLEKRLPRSLIPNDTNSSSFRILSPLFTMVFGVYDPVVVEFIEESKADESLPAMLVPLMQLSHVMNYLWALPNDDPERDRLFRITVNKDIVEYLGRHTGALNEFIENPEKKEVTPFRNMEKVTQAEYFKKMKMPYVFLCHKGNVTLSRNNKSLEDSIFLLRTSDDMKDTYELPIETIDLSTVDLSNLKSGVMIQPTKLNTTMTLTKKETTIGRVLFQLLLLRQIQLTYPEIPSEQIDSTVPLRKSSMRSTTKKSKKRVSFKNGTNPSTNISSKESDKNNL